MGWAKLASVVLGVVLVILVLAIFSVLGYVFLVQHPTLNCQCPAGSNGTYPNCTFVSCPTCPGPGLVPSLSSCLATYPLVPTPTQLATILNPNNPSLPIIPSTSSCQVYYPNNLQNPPVCQNISGEALDNTVGYIILNEVTDNYFSLGFYTPCGVACASCYYIGTNTLTPSSTINVNWILPWAAIQTYGISDWTSMFRWNQTCSYVGQYNSFPGTGNNFYQPFYGGAAIYIQVAGAVFPAPILYNSQPDVFPIVPVKGPLFDPATQLMLLHITGSKGNYNWTMYTLPAVSTFSHNWVSQLVPLPAS